MTARSRRELFADVGTGMILAGLGVGVATDLGFQTAFAADGPDRLTFGDLEPLVALLQDTPPDRVLGTALAKLRDGTDLKRLVAATALANARSFGGEDYVGFHTLMALPPAYHMAIEEPKEDRRPLAVLKVLYRNSARLTERGTTADTLKPIQPADHGGGTKLRDAARAKDMTAAERTFAADCQGDPTAALSSLMEMVDDSTEVHRVVLASRAWELVGFVGTERAHTLLRQSVRYCVKAEAHAGNVKYGQEARDLLPKLLDRHHLLSKSPGTRPVDDTQLSELADTLFRASAADAADAAAVALAGGMLPDAVAEAVCLAANQLVLRDEGRPSGQTAANKPVGSIHGDSIGVHACDSANAWRKLAKAGDRRTQVTSILLGAYQVARDRAGRGGNFLKWEPYPRADHRDAVRSVDAGKLLAELDAAIRNKDQSRAVALVHRLGEEKASAAEVFAVCRGYAVSEDGALHAEKYYRTTTEEYAASRPAFRWRQLEALARVTASAFGQPAPGYKDACRLLKV